MYGLFFSLIFGSSYHCSLLIPYVWSHWGRHEVESRLNVWFFFFKKKKIPFYAFQKKIQTFILWNLSSSLRLMVIIIIKKMFFINSKWFLGLMDRGNQKFKLLVWFLLLPEWLGELAFVRFFKISLYVLMVHMLVNHSISIG